MNFRNCLLIFSLACLCACGFQLRGTSMAALQGSKFYIKSSGSYALAKEVKKQLSIADIQIVNSSHDADYVVEIGNESFERKILSISADTGKVEEYELIYNTTLSVTDAAGKKLVSDDPVTTQRDFTSGEVTVLGKSDEVNRLHEEIRQYAAENIVRKLRYVTQ